MLEIRFHGRGGQGTVVATILLAKAFFGAGYFVQSFPLFGVERRGAPVEAYLRINSREVRLRTNVYTPDHVVVLDRTLLQGINVTQGLKPQGWILLNAHCSPLQIERFSGYQLAFVDATRIALKHQLGTRTHPIVNTAIMGALARVLGMPPMDTIAMAVKEEIADRYVNNMDAAQDAYDDVQLLGFIQPSADLAPCI
jgi:2-oxoacid:acceptor oxidoreductase gamma subunit (pyruvate/2-ketoisovalerate family)